MLKYTSPGVARYYGGVATQNLSSTFDPTASIGDPLRSSAYAVMTDVLSKPMNWKWSGEKKASNKLDTGNYLNYTRTAGTATSYTASQV